MSPSTKKERVLEATVEILSESEKPLTAKRIACIMMQKNPNFNVTSHELAQLIRQESEVVSVNKKRGVFLYTLH